MLVMLVHLRFLSISFITFSRCIACPSSSAGVQHGGQTGSEGRAHRPERNSAHRGHGGARSAGSPQQVGNSPRGAREDAHRIQN